MNIALLTANLLMILVLPLHIIWGDKDIRTIQPDSIKYKKLETWIMARGAFHVVSVDLFLITVGVTLINFTNTLDHYKVLLLNIICLYLFFNAVVFFTCVAMSPALPKKYFRLFQWALFLVIGGLIYLGK